MADFLFLTAVYVLLLLVLAAAGYALWDLIRDLFDP